jgi:hypothetical protein
MLAAKALHEGDDVLVGTETVAELFHFDGSTTRLDTGATAALERIAEADGRPHLVLRLGVGNSWHRTATSRSRGGQYEARTPAAAALARSAVFVIRSRPDGSAWFAALDGTVVVRGTAGGTVVLRAGEEVTAAADGTVGDVAEPGREGLAHDDWVAVNGLLDEEEAAAAPVAPEAEPEPEGEPEGDALADDSEPEPRPAHSIDGDDEFDEFDEFVDDDHPWRVGVAAAVAISIAIFSVVIGRAGTATPIDPEKDPAIAVPGPPAFATPAFAARNDVPPGPSPTVAAEPDGPPSTAAATGTTATTAAAATTKATAAEDTYKLVGRSCSRGGTNVIAYQGTLHNHASTARTYTVHVEFSTSRGTVVARASDTVTVPGGGTRAVRATTAPLRNAGTASTCDAVRVEAA